MSLEPNEKLIWMGIKRPSQTASEVQTEINLLESGVGDYDAFQTGVSNQSSYSEFKTYLTNNGFTSDQADDFISKVKNNFTDEDSSGTSWDEFQDFVVNQTDSYEEFMTGFGSLNTIGSEQTTQDGDKIAGIRFFESDGITKDGIAAPLGSVEVFGKEVHFSETGNVSSSVDPVTFSNIQSDATDDVGTIGDTITISADVSNPNSTSQDIIVTFSEDGSHLDDKVITIGGNSTVTVSFTVTKSEAQCHDYSIGSSSELTVCWAPSGILV